MKISFLIPAFNEEPTIGKVLNKVLMLPFDDREIIVVDDASTDRTSQIVEDYQAKIDCVKLIRQSTNGGKTSAIDVAIQHASGDVVIIQDADLEYDPDEIPDIVAPILADVADVVYGSRFLVKRASRVLYFYHYLANKGLTFFSNILTNRNMSDIETCYKAFRKEVIKPIKLTSSGFGMEVEITAMVCKTRARTYEVPISYYGRTYEEGKKIGLKDGIAAIWYIFYYNLIHPLTSPGKRYIETVNEHLQSRAS